MDKDRGRNVDRWVTQQLCFYIQIFSYYNRGVQHSATLQMLHEAVSQLPAPFFSLTRKQDSKILELLHLRQQLIPYLEWALHPFVLTHANFHLNCFTLS